jgi:SAM-dependent methyltransferase
VAWFVEAFGPWYPVVYPHRDAAEADALIGTLSGLLSADGGRWLDVGCGAGRHLPRVVAAGAKPIGTDLSAALLEAARGVREEAGGRWPLVRADMRALPFASGSMRVASSLFTSFGYFDAASDRGVLAEAARVLAPGGFHVLDFLNRDVVTAHPMRHTARVSGDWRIEEWRRIEDGRRVVKRVRVTPAGGGDAVADYEERVNLYGRDELAAMLGDAGLAVRHAFGEYDGRPFDASASSRLVLVSRKEPLA